MNMNKALQHLYKAVSGQDTKKVNISKLLVDIHKALTGEDSANKNNWARIIDSMAENWSGGGGGNPNYVQTITATAENPCVGISASSLLSALLDNNASAEITLTNANLGVYVKMPITTVGQTLVASKIDSDNMSGFEASWNASNNEEATARKLIMINNGQTTDGTAYASMIASELTIIWHPLP